MDLIVNQVMQFQVVHVSDGYRAVEVLTGTSITQSYLTVSSKRNALPEFSVLQMRSEIIHHFRFQGIFIFLLEIFPRGIYIIICDIEGIHDVNLVCTVEYRRCNVEAECLGCKA